MYGSSIPQQICRGNASVAVFLERAINRPKTVILAKIRHNWLFVTVTFPMEGGSDCAHGTHMCSRYGSTTRETRTTIIT